MIKNIRFETLDLDNHPWQHALLEPYLQRLVVGDRVIKVANAYVRPALPWEDCEETSYDVGRVVERTNKLLSVLLDGATLPVWCRQLPTETHYQCLRQFFNVTQ